MRRKLQHTYPSGIHVVMVLVFDILLVDLISTNSSRPYSGINIAINPNCPSHLILSLSLPEFFLSPSHTSLVPRLSWGREKREPGNQVLHAHAPTYSMRTICERISITMFFGKGQRMRMQWLLGSLFPSPKRAWGRGYLAYMHLTCTHYQMCA